jgi:hypothetical protein
MFKLQEKPSNLKREHPALQKMKFLNFFANPDLDCESGSGSRDPVESGSRAFEIFYFIFIVRVVDPEFFSKIRIRFQIRFRVFLNNKIPYIMYCAVLIVHNGTMSVEFFFNPI